MLLLNCAVYGKKNAASIENQKLNNISNDQFKMNKINNKFLLPGDNFMPELQLKQPGFTHSDCGAFTKHHLKIV